MAIDLLQMSGKYDVPTVKLDVLEALTTYFPTSYDGFAHLVHRWTHNTLTRLMHSWARPTPTHPFSEIADFARLACLFRDHSPRHLPSTLAQLSMTALWWDAEKGEVVHILEIISPIAGLDPQMRLAIQGGRYIMSRRARHEVFRSLFRPSTCHTAGKCNGTKLSLISLLDAGDGCIHPLRHIRLRDPIALISLGLCIHCRETFIHDRDAGCKELWSDLPGILGLPSWENLLRDA